MYTHFLTKNQRGEIATAILLFSLGAMAIGSLLGLNEIRKGRLSTVFTNAQTVCRYTSTAYIRDESGTKIYTLDDKNSKFSIAYYFKTTGSQQPNIGTDTFEVTDDNTIKPIPKDVLLASNFRNIPITLGLNYDNTKYSIEPFCEGAACKFPDKNTVITNFECGINLKYGWKIKKTNTTTISPAPPRIAATSSNACSTYQLTICANGAAPCEPVQEATEVWLDDIHRYIGNEEGRVTFDTPPAPLMYKGFTNYISVSSQEERYPFKLDATCGATVYTGKEGTPIPTPVYPKGTVQVNVKIQGTIPAQRQLRASICKVDGDFNPQCLPGGSYFNNQTGTVSSFGQGEIPVGQAAVVIYPALFDNGGNYVESTPVKITSGTNCRSILATDPPRCIFFINEGDTTELDLTVSISEPVTPTVSPSISRSPSTTISAPTGVVAYCPAEKEFEGQGIVPELAARIKWVAATQARGYKIVVDDLNVQGTPNENTCTAPQDKNGDFCTKILGGSVGSLNVHTNNIKPDGTTFEFTPILGHSYRSFIRSIDSNGNFSDKSQEIKFNCEGTNRTTSPSTIPTALPPAELTCRYKPTAVLEAPANINLETYTFISTTGGGATHFNKIEKLPNGRQRASFTGEYLINSNQYTTARVTLSGPNITDLKTICSPSGACPVRDTTMKPNQIDVSVDCRFQDIMYGWNLLPVPTKKLTPRPQITKTIPPRADLDGDGIISVADFILFMRNRQGSQGISSLATQASEILSNIGNKIEIIK